jgi:hypothetical protein
MSFGVVRHTCALTVTLHDPPTKRFSPVIFKGIFSNIFHKYISFAYTCSASACVYQIQSINEGFVSDVDVLTV